MEPGSKQDEVVNMTRAKEALSPWLNHPRKTIIQVEGLVVAAAALLLLQLILGSCKRRWHNSFIRYGLQACNGIMFPLIVYTLGTMQSSPIKNSFYPVWAGFLIMASAGTAPVRQHDFYDSFYKKYIQISSEFFRDFFYAIMFIMLMNPYNYNSKTAWDLKQRLKNGRSSSRCVAALVGFVLCTKFVESIYLLVSGYKYKGGLFFLKKKSRRTQDAEGSMEEIAQDCACGSDPQSMKGYKYAICYGPSQRITIDQIWDSCGNSADGIALKDLCLSCALFGRLVEQHYFGEVCRGTSRLEDHDFVFKKLLPSEGDFERAFRIIEVELGFCYDFFFTKYFCTFIWLNSQMRVIQSLFLLKTILIVLVGVFTIRKSLVLETPNPIIEVHISEADHVITLLVLGIALLVELVQAAFYLASNWAQVSLACIHVKKCCCIPNALIFMFGKVIGYLRMVMMSGQLRNKIDQHTVIFRQWYQQPDPVEVSDAVKRAIAGSLRSTYANNLTTTIAETSLWQNEMFDQYSWALNDLSQLEVMLIWHIATEYCHISDDPSNGNGTTPSSNHRVLGAHLFGYVLQLLRLDPRRNKIARDSHQGVAVHLSRYCAHLIGSVPELLPYHEADIEELAQEVMEEQKKLFGSNYRLVEIYNEMKKLGTEDTREMFQRGVKLGKQLKSQPDADCWEVLKDFWAETIVHVSALHYTTKQHMKHLENGGEFLTHIWALLSHAGILSLNRNKGQEGQANLGSSPLAVALV